MLIHMQVKLLIMITALVDLHIGLMSGGIIYALLWTQSTGSIIIARTWTEGKKSEILPWQSPACIEHRSGEKYPSRADSRRRLGSPLPTLLQIVFQARIFSDNDGLTHCYTRHNVVTHRPHVSFLHATTFDAARPNLHCAAEFETCWNGEEMVHVSEMYNQSRYQGCGQASNSCLTGIIRRRQIA